MPDGYDITVEVNGRKVALFLTRRALEAIRENPDTHALYAKKLFNAALDQIQD